jgi:hypothetical protein
MATSGCKTSMVAPLGGAAGGSGSVHHRVLMMMSMVGPLGALRWVRQCPSPSFEDDVDCGPPGGAAGGFGIVHHLVLKTTSMAGPLGVLLVGPTASTTEFEDNIDGRPLGRHC